MKNQIIYFVFAIAMLICRVASAQSFTANGGTDITIQVGDSVHLAWDFTGFYNTFGMFPVSFHPIQTVGDSVMYPQNTVVYRVVYSNGISSANLFVTVRVVNSNLTFLKKSEFVGTNANQLKIKVDGLTPGDTVNTILFFYTPTDTFLWSTPYGYTADTYTFPLSFLEAETDYCYKIIGCGDTVLGCFMTKDCPVFALEPSMSFTTSNSITQYFRIVFPAVYDGTIFNVEMEVRDSMTNQLVTQFPGGGLDYGISIADSVYVSGASTDTLDFGLPVSGLDSCRTYKFQAKISLENQCDSTGLTYSTVFVKTKGCKPVVGIEDNKEENDFTLYPNPATNQIGFESSFDGDYKIYDAQGREVLTGGVIFGENRIAVSSLSVGMYYFYNIPGGSRGGGVAKVLKFFVVR